MEIIWQLGLVVFLVLLNGYFVASEFSLVSVRKTRIDELVKRGNRTAKLVQKALADLDSVISATQLGITIASLALGWVGEPAIAGFLLPYFEFLPHYISSITAHGVSVVVAFTAITFLHIVLGELAPKTIALQSSEKTALFIIAPLSIFTQIFRPCIWLLNTAGGIVLRIFGFSTSSNQVMHSEEEIKMLLAQSARGGLIAQKEADMIYSVFRLGDIPVKQIMVPRTNVIAFNVSAMLRDITRKIERHPHSRFPVFEHSIDTIIGFIHVKDIYKAVFKQRIDRKLAETRLVREVISVAENSRIDTVLREMRKKRVHIAVVYDEYGGTAGIVTLEDILESLVGEIQDEFEQPAQEMQKQADGSYIIDGLTAIDRVQTKFHLPMRGQGYTTIGGLVLGLLGHEAKKGDTVQIGTTVFVVEKTEGKRIKVLRLMKDTKRKNPTKKQRVKGSEK